MGRKNSSSDQQETVGESTDKKPEDITGAPVENRTKKASNRAATGAAAEDPYAEASLEEVFERLEETLSKMDSPDLPLEEAFALYEQGMKMVAAADGKLKTVEQKLKVINQEN